MNWRDHETNIVHEVVDYTMNLWGGTPPSQFTKQLRCGKYVSLDEQGNIAIPNSPLVVTWAPTNDATTCITCIASHVHGHAVARTEDTVLEEYARVAGYDPDDSGEILLDDDD